MSRKNYLFFAVCILRTTLFTAQINSDSLNLMVFKTRSDDTVKVNELNQVAKDLLKKEPELSWQYLEEAERSADRIKYWKGKKTTIFIRSDLSMEDGKHKQAFDYLNEALELCIKNKNPEEIVSCYLQLAKYYETLNDPVKALFYYRKALSFEERLKNISLQAQIVWKVANFYKDRGEYADAKINYLEADRLFAEAKDTLSRFNVHYKIYNLEKELENFKECMKIAINALKIVEHSRYYEKTGIAHSMIGTIFYTFENYDEAKKEFIESLNIYRKHHIDAMVPRALGNINNVFLSKGQFDSVIKISLYILEVVKKHPHKPTINRTYNALGIAYFMKKNFTKGEMYLKEGIRLILEENDKIDMVNAYGNNGEIYYEFEKYNKAKDNILKAVELGEKINYRRGLERFYETFSLIEEALGNYREAYTYLCKFRVLRDSLFKEEYISRAFNENQKHKFESRMFADSLQNLRARAEYQKQLLMNEIELKNSVFIKRWGVGFLIMFLILLIALMYRFKILRQQKITIEQHNLRYDTLLREIHHRVKNNLQVISSIIDLEGMRQKDPQSLAAYENLKPRISAVLLVHNMLYQQQRMQTINISEYFEQLSQQLIKVISTNRSFVFQLKQNVQPLNLRAEKMIPLALITIELILLSKNREQEYLTAEIEIKKEGDFLFMKYTDHNQMIHRAIKEIKYKERLNWIRKLSSQCKEGIGAYYEKPFGHYSLTFKLH